MLPIPGLQRDRHLHAHHIIHWIHGGPTELDNLVLLCPFHHRLVHEGGWTVTGGPHEQLAFVAPRGERTTVAPPEPTDPGAVPRRHRRAGRKPALICHRDGTRPDYAEIISHIR